MCARVCVCVWGCTGGWELQTGEEIRGRREESERAGRGLSGVNIRIHFCICETSRLSTIGVLPCAAGPDALQCRQAAARREGQVRALWVVGCATCPEGPASCRPLAFFICLFSLLAPSSVLLQAGSPPVTFPPHPSSPPPSAGWHPCSPRWRPCSCKCRRRQRPGKRQRCERCGGGACRLKCRDEENV